MDSFPFLRGQILWFSVTVIFIVFWNFKQLFLEEYDVWKGRDQQGRPTYTTLTDIWSFC